MANYFHDDDGARLADNYYGGLLLFMLDTLIANQGNTLSEEDVSYFTSVRENAESQWRNALRCDELYYRAEKTELSAEEKAEFERLDGMARGPAWEELCERAERCIANWCLANTALVDRSGKRVVAGGVSDVMEIFVRPEVVESRVPPSVRGPVGECAICGGKGWIASKVVSEFPTMCSCRH